MQILDLLWASKVSLTEKPIERGKDYTEMIEKAELGEERLKQILHPEQLEHFDQFMKDYDLMRDYAECENFIDGFRMGAKIMMDIQSNDVGGDM